MDIQYQPAMHSAPSPPPLRSVRLLDQLRERIRYRHCNLSTKKSCVYWVRAYILFHGLRHPRQMGGSEVEALLSHSFATHVLNHGAGDVLSPLDSLRCAEPAAAHLH